ncbi:MAG: response regulator transcription factor [Akkermansiaceae bacterium]|nr:response regulator transcription factor [Akkermansiaceae bacterium]NNM28642.1 response regulator transcription factor [Akkermansiaceae bacterium]
MSNPVTVMLVEDNREYREVIRLALRRDENIELASEFGTAEIALRSLQDRSQSGAPDIILLDLRLPGMTGLEALPEFAKVLPEARIIILTQSDSEADVLRAIALGAAGYLLKSSTVAEIKDGIRTVIDGGASLDPGVAKFLLKTLQSRLPKAEAEKVLSEREVEILILLGEGLVKKEIGDRLGISYPTVDSHVRHIYEKLDVHNAPSAISAAHRLGIFPPEG